MSATPINLNRARKARARDEKRKQADANSVKFGRTKAERALDKAREEKANRTLDGHHLESDHDE